MTTIGKMFTLLVVGAILVAMFTHPAGSAGDMAVGGSVIDNALGTVAGSGVSSGTKGSVAFGGASANFG